MRKQKICLLILFILILLPISYNCLKENTSVVLKDNKKNNYKTSTISMMYETSSGSGEYAESSDNIWNTNGYIFNEKLSTCVNGSTLSWNGDTASVVFKGNMSDKCFVYFDKLPPIISDVCSLGNSLSNCIKLLYTSDGTNDLYYHDGKGSYTNASYEAKDNSYRYSGADPNNYVCFGSEEEICPTDSLYRIIGVFGDRVKLIKYDYATSTALGTGGAYFNTYSETGNYGTNKGSNSTSSIGVYYWNKSGTNTWSSSTLNTTNLNTTYTSYLGSTWTNLIETTTWIAGGNTYDNIVNRTINNVYTNEITSPAESTTHSAKIGLMYVSDYGYAAVPSAWLTNLGSYSNSEVNTANWMYMGLREWTITRNSEGTNLANAIVNGGSVYGGPSIYYVGSGGYAIRPTFYLKSSAAYSSGTGTASDPIRLSI